MGKQQQRPNSGGMGDETTTPEVRQSQGASSTPIGMGWRPRAKPRSAGARIYRTTVPAVRRARRDCHRILHRCRRSLFVGYTSSMRTQILGRQSLAPAQKKGTAGISGREAEFAESGGQVYGEYKMTKTMPPSPQQRLHGWHRCRKQR
jgi:hypothetical protein